MKGVSPFVATILLVALVIGIGGLISVFVTNLVTTSSGVTSNQSQSLSKCAGAWINVYRVTSTTVFYSNPNSQNITGLNIILSDGTQNPCVSGTFIAPGASNSTNISTASCAPATGILANTSVTIRGLCQLIVPVEGNCKVGQTCWAT